MSFPGPVSCVGITLTTSPQFIPYQSPPPLMMMTVMKRYVCVMVRINVNWKKVYCFAWEARRFAKSENIVRSFCVWAASQFSVVSGALLAVVYVCLYGAQKTVPPNMASFTTETALFIVIRGYGRSIQSI